jgi:SOS-response transcriptional repressor LexA
MAKQNVRGIATRERILAFLRKNAECDTCEPPSLAEIAEAAGLKSKGAVAYQLRVLRQQHRIEWNPGERRSITLVE